MGQKKLIIYDTTLRDGAQTVGISFSLQDKLRIAHALDRLNIDYIEGGWPGSNPKDDLFFSEIKKQKLKHSRVAAFGSTKRPGTRCADDPLVQSLVQSGAGTVTIVAKAWDFHVTTALNISLDDNLALIHDTVAYLKDRGKEVFLDAEHFFDGYLANGPYALAVIEKAAAAGVDAVILCDTNGGMLPHQAGEITSAVIQKASVPVGVHFHNDTGVAVANSISAVISGARQVQGTMNGYGERCGNCDLVTFIPNAVLKMGCSCAAQKSLIHLTEISRFVSETANLAHNERAPFVGASSFAHKGGIHVSGLQRDTKTYEHIEPEQVGNRRQVLVSELSGKSNIEFKARELGIDINEKVELPGNVLKKIKKLEDQGFQFEAAEGSFELIIRQATGEYAPFFTLKGFRVITEMSETKELYCEATIRVEVGGKIEHTAANGNGPVAALDNALRKALEKFYPEIREMHLSDYKVRVLNEKDGTGSAVRVLIDNGRGTSHWGTVGVSTNIIEASWQALVDGIEFLLFKKKEKDKGYV